MAFIVKASINNEKKTYITEEPGFNRICMQLFGTAPAASEYRKAGMARIATFTRRGIVYRIEVVSESAARESASMFSDRPDLMAEIDNAIPLVCGEEAAKQQKQSNIILRVSEDQKLRWTEAAERQGRSLSDFIRAAVESQL